MLAYRKPEYNYSFLMERLDGDAQKDKVRLGWKEKNNPSNSLED
ncbi:MAG: hypothetical protein ACE5PV_13150 [Candidatus Poribacteria bacterium]